jgi:hypothetical protein
MCVVKQAWCFYTGFFYLRDALRFCEFFAAFAGFPADEHLGRKERKEAQRTFRYTQSEI